MQSILTRAITAASYALGKGRAGNTSQSVPDIFAGTVWLCDEIADATDQLFNASMKLRIARTMRDLAGMREATAEIVTAADQINRMAGDSLTRVIAWHADHLARTEKRP